MKYRAFISLSLIFGALTSCTSIGIRFYEQADYEIVDKEETIEVREYHDILVAETYARGTYDEAYSDAFSRLTDYLNGRNLSRSYVSSTRAQGLHVPTEVITPKIPIIISEEDRGFRVGMVLPDTYAPETAPIPLDSRVQIRRIPSKMIATIRYAGTPSREQLAENKGYLYAWLEKRRYKVTSDIRRAQFDTNETLSMFRRNEIHVDVE